MPTSHDSGHDAAAYVLGALEPAEAETFTRHLSECADCRDEVEAFRGVVDALPMSAPRYPAPRRLRRRVMRAVRSEARPGPRPVAGLRWPRPRLALGTVAAAAVIAVTVFAGLEISGPGPGHLIQARVIGVSGSAELRVVDGRGELIVNHISPPPRGRVYEVWLKAQNANPVPARALFTVGPGGRARVGLPRSLAGIQQVMVTAEPDGGSLSPTSAPVIVARLT